MRAKVQTELKRVPEIAVVLVRKGSYTTLNIAKETENLGKERENPKNLVNDLKNGHQKFCPWKWTFFPKKTSFRNLVPPKFCPSPHWDILCALEGVCRLNVEVTKLKWPWPLQQTIWRSNKPFQRCSFWAILTIYFYPNQSRRLKI